MTFFDGSSVVGQCYPGLHGYILLFQIIVLSSSMGFALGNIRHLINVHEGSSSQTSHGQQNDQGPIS